MGEGDDDEEEEDGALDNADEDASRVLVKDCEDAAREPTSLERVSSPIGMGKRLIDRYAGTKRTVSVVVSKGLPSSST